MRIQINRFSSIHCHLYVHSLSLSPSFVILNEHVSLIAPNPIDSDSIKIMMTNDTEVTVMWKVSIYINKENVYSYDPGILIHFQPAKIDDECSMVAVEHYEVRISSSDGEIILERIVPDNATTFMFDHMDDDLIATFNISVTVVNINGQRSESSVVERNITGMHIPSISSKYTDCDTCNCV